MLTTTALLVQPAGASAEPGTCPSCCLQDLVFSKGQQIASQPCRPAPMEQRAAGVWRDAVCTALLLSAPCRRTSLNHFWGWRTPNLFSSFTGHSDMHFTTSRTEGLGPVLMDFFRVWTLLSSSPTNQGASHTSSFTHRMTGQLPA